MFSHARNLEFEAAARLRDEVQELRRVGFGSAGTQDRVVLPCLLRVPFGIVAPGRDAAGPFPR